MHSIAHHCLDVAACASTLLRYFPPPVAVPPSSLVALIACHDVGKFSRTFQAKEEGLWPATLGAFWPPPAGYPHDDVGFLLLSGPLLDSLDPIFAHWRTRAAREALLRAIAGHHGRPPRADREELPIAVADATCIDAARAFLAAACTAIAPDPLPPLARVGRQSLAWFLAGLVVAADWLGSARRWFPMVSAPEHADLARYFTEHALPHAESAVSASGLVPSSVAAPAGLAALFPALAAPRPLQAWAEGVALPAGPALFVIEDATGAGKTEAAILLAHRLMAGGYASGLFFALPTMASANAMYDRLALAYERLFAPGPHRPSLVLAHARRMLNPHFTDHIFEDAASPGVLPPDPADQTAGAQCSAWIASDRRKVFLAHVGVGTVDQALLGVLPTRHAPLRLFGLSRRILIIDEAHAYDAYMAEELYRLLAFHAALGGSAIVLSATLTARQRKNLAEAFLGARIDAAFDKAAPYPLASTISRAEVRATAYAMVPELQRRVPVERLADTDAAIRVVRDAEEAGAAVAWVRNSVDDAIEAAAQLRALGAAPLLFHARFAMGDRLAIEREVLHRFGKDSTSVLRRGQVLVATQVIEQSLDLDFDVLVSDLAPADLIIQRTGRLWRHRRKRRPCAEPRLFLLAPEPVPNPGENWLGAELRRTGAVYGDHALLWRSARKLLAAGEIATPGGIRSLIEAAYDTEAPDAEPPGLERATKRAKGEWYAARGAAWQNLLEIDHPYERRAGLWEPDARTPTRLGDPRITLRLARLDRGCVVPWSAGDSLSQAWSLSEVAVRVGRISGAAPDPKADPLIALAKQDWPAWDRDIPMLVLRAHGDAWHTRALASEGRVQPLIYDRFYGLIFPEADKPA